MILQEIFDSDIEIQWHVSAREISGGFHLAGQMFYVIAQRYPAEDLINSVEMSDKNWDNNSDFRQKYDKFASQLKDGGGAWIVFSVEDTSGHERHDVTGKMHGKAYALFAAIKKSIDYVVEQWRPSFIIFTADEKSRRKLYDRMVKGTNHFMYIDIGGEKRYVVIP